MRAPNPNLREFPVFVHLLLPLLLQQLVSHAHTISRGQLYSQQSVCQGKVVSSDHRKQTQSVRSLIQCLSVCQATEGCVAVVHEPDSGLCHLGDSFAWGNCSNMEPVGAVKMRQYEKKISCENGGRVENGGCVCTQPYHGHRCEKILRDCSDAAPYANDTNQNVMVVRPVSSPDPFSVHCQSKFGRTFILRNENGLDFNRSWQEYVDGFGDVAQDHWLGLDHIYHLTHNNRGYSIKMVVTLTNGSKIYFEYDSFQLASSAEGYTFYATNGNYAKKQGRDCLGPLLGAPFSTYDNDRDGSVIVNCAQRHGFGWWFQGEHCSPACLPLGKQNKFSFWWPGDPSDAFWSMVFGNVSIAEIRVFLTVQ